jgi:hypothetical protein
VAHDRKKFALRLARGFRLDTQLFRLPAGNAQPFIADEDASDFELLQIARDDAEKDCRREEEIVVDEHQRRQRVDHQDDDLVGSENDGRDRCDHDPADRQEARADDEDQDHAGIIGTLAGTFGHRGHRHDAEPRDYHRRGEEELREAREKLRIGKTDHPEQDGTDHRVANPCRDHQGFGDDAEIEDAERRIGERRREERRPHDRQRLEDGIDMEAPLNSAIHEAQRHRV